VRSALSSTPYAFIRPAFGDVSICLDQVLAFALTFRHRLRSFPQSSRFALHGRCSRVSSMTPVSCRKHIVQVYAALGRVLRFAFPISLALPPKAVGLRHFARLAQRIPSA